jgi:hypothetical protein
VVFLAEPGACAGRLEPGQDLVPAWLATMLDWHVWPSASPWAVSSRARTVCEHVDYELVWAQRPEWFQRREHVGAPPPEVLFAAKGELADLGQRLVLDVQLEEIDGQLALAVYGAGVVGRLTDREWKAVASLLTTCSARIREPLPDVDVDNGPLHLIRPARSSRPGQRGLPTGIQPEGWESGDWMHTWWSYPLFGALRPDCLCTAHTPEARAVQVGLEGRDSA